MAEEQKQSKFPSEVIDLPSKGKAYVGESPLASGKIEVKCSDGTEDRKFLLESPQQALLVPNMIWDEQRYMSEDAVLLVLSNTYYDSKDYIEDYDEFLMMRENIE